MLMNIEKVLGIVCSVEQNIQNTRYE